MKEQTINLKTIIRLVLVLVFGYAVNMLPSELSAQNQEMEEANQIMKGMNESLKEVNADIEQVQSTYQQLKDCLSGAGETGSECQRYIDMLYNMEGAGIEVQDQVMTVKELGNQIIQRFEESNAFQMLRDAANTFGSIGTMVDNSANALEFAQQFNPEGARSDPTRGLRMIGEAIGNAAGSLPYPMDKIFEGYANAVTNVVGKLNDLQNKIEEARQGSLGGSYSGYANAQEFFDANFASSSRLSIEFFDVTSQFPLLGGDVQVFQNLGSLSSEYYVYKGDTNRGWIAPPVFREIYAYFEALPSSSRSDITVAYRPELFVSQAISNPRPRIEEGREHYNLFMEVDRQFNVRRILEEMQLLESMNSLLEYGEEAFIGYWLFIAEKIRDIRDIVDVITGYVYFEGRVLRQTVAGQEVAPGEPVTLTVDGGGTGRVISDENGNYFVYTQGEIGSNYTISAGQGDERTEEPGRFYQRGIDYDLVLEQIEETPVSLTISPSEATLEVGETVNFTALAIFEDSTVTNVTEIEGIGWSIGSPTFTATKAGNFPVSVTYMGFVANASITVEEEETPVSLTISPSETTLEVGETATFTAFAVYEDETSTNITGFGETTWTPASSFTATEAGETTITVSYRGLSANATVTVEEETQCNEPSEVPDDEGGCRCNTEEGYEPNAELGKCIHIDDALDEVTEEGEELCDEEVLTASLARLDELVAGGNRIAANFRSTLNKFMKEVNDQNSNVCENNIIAAAYAGAKKSLSEYELLEDEAVSLSTDLILEGSLCPLEELSLDLNSILQKVSQLGPPRGQIEDGIAAMQNQLQTFGCDDQEVEDQGDTIAEQTDPEIIQAGGTGATETCGDGIDNDGDGLIDEDCEGTGNFNVIIVLYDSGSAADDVFGLSVSGQGNLGTTPEGGSRTYPLRLSPGSYVATVTVISAPDDIGTFTIRILEGDQEIAGDTGNPPQGTVVSVPFTVGGGSETSAEAESILPMLMNFMRQIEQSEGGDH